MSTSTLPRVSIIIDNQLKQIAKRRSKQRGYGNLSAYLRRLLIEDLQKDDDVFLYQLDQGELDDQKLDHAFGQSTQQTKQKKSKTFTTPDALIKELES